MRSIFLQGILLTNTIPKKLKKFSNKIEKYNNFLKLSKIKSLDFCINFILKFKSIDKIVIGVNNLNQLKEVLNYNNVKKHYLNNIFSTNNQKLINPKKW